VIGIGGSAQCDGQVLVTEDMLGLFERVPRFVKRYAEVATTIEEAAARYAQDVRERAFPGWSRPTSPSRRRPAF
jgi:3-methyl-2-oxobutanoate hydroxymethyltransferase